MIYTSEFAALVDSGMDGRANGLGVGFLKATGEGVTGESSEIFKTEMISSTLALQRLESR